MWKVLNSKIGNRSNSVMHPKYLIENEKVITDMDDVVNGFNVFL